MILANKSIVSYFYGINPAQAENPISFLLCFRDPNYVQKLWKNTGVSILEGGRPRSEGSKQTESRRQKGGGPRGQVLWPRGTLYLPACWPSGLQFKPIAFVSKILNRAL